MADEEGNLSDCKKKDRKELVHSTHGSRVGMRSRC